MSEQAQSEKPQDQTAGNQPKNEAAAAVEAPADSDSASVIAENLEFLKSRIGRGEAFMGMLVGFGVFAFSMFLTWAKIPAGIGIRAMDGGASSGWHEHAYSAIIPLAVMLYPALRKRAVKIKFVLIGTVISFGMLGYCNVIRRTSWQTTEYYEYCRTNLGSDLGAGFWLGLIAMSVISVCGLAWAVHTKGEFKQ